MAEFSREYNIEVGTDPQYSDFSLEEEFENLKDGSYLTIICEGFGITAIGKTDEGMREVRYKGGWMEWERFLEQFKQASSSK